MTLSASEVARFHADGFLLGPRVLDDTTVDELRAELDSVIASYDSPVGDGTPRPVHMWNLSGEDEAPVWQVVNIWMAAPGFRRLLHHPTIIEHVAQLTGASQLRLWHDQIQYKPARTGGVNDWHQDAPFWPVLTPMTEVSAWVALDDVDETNGCMRMVRGSHRWGNQIDVVRAMPFDAPLSSFAGSPVEVVPRPVAKGRVHYHHALTWHGSGPNDSDGPRRAIALHFMTDETRFVSSGRHVMKPYISVADGDVVSGEAFPVVFDRGLVPSSSSSSSWS